MPAELLGAWEAFSGQAERVEQAKQALLSCLPVGRVDPVPVPVGCDVLVDELTAVAREMQRWRVDEVDVQWARCRDALAEAVAAVPHAREVATTSTELDALLDAVTGVVEPLDAWHDAERHWLRLRR